MIVLLVNIKYMKMGPVGWVAFILVVIGALNWGLVAINPEYDVVSAILGSGTTLARIVFGLVGLSGVITLLGAFMKKSSSSQM